MSRLTPFVLILPLLTACKKEEAPAATPPPPPAAASKPAMDLGSIPPPPEGSLSGTIQVAPAVAASVKAGDTIYVIARNAATNAAIAVVRLVAPEKWPLEFALSGSHSMQPGTGLFGKVKLEARVDKDGDAMTKKPGDVVGQVKELVEVPAKGVVLTLDTVL
jgi:hypothetical protein